MREPTDRDAMLERGGMPIIGGPTSMMVMSSPVSRACTCRARCPSGCFHHLITLHCWAGLPGSDTVMIRPVGSSGLGAEGTVDWPQTMPVVTHVARSTVIHVDRTIRLVSLLRTRRFPAGLSP
jgi:hypothetical protein